jgi:hypothetical protein
MYRPLRSRARRRRSTTPQRETRAWAGRPARKRLPRSGERHALGEQGALDRTMSVPERAPGPWGAYTVNEVALRHRAGVEEETQDADVAYPHLGESEPTRYRDGWLLD